MKSNFQKYPHLNLVLMVTPLQGHVLFTAQNMVSCPLKTASLSNSLKKLHRGRGRGLRHDKGDSGHVWNNNELLPPVYEVREQVK